MEPLLPSIGFSLGHRGSDLVVQLLKAQCWMQPASQGCPLSSPSPRLRWDVRAPWKSLLMLREGEEVLFLSGVGESVVSVMDSHCDRL